MPEFCFRVFNIDKETLLAICDTDIVGKTFREENLVLGAPKSFYCKSECGPIKAKRLFEDATIINATGHKIVELLIELGHVDRQRILRVKGVPHAQMVRVTEGGFSERSENLLESQRRAEDE